MSFDGRAFLNSARLLMDFPTADLPSMVEEANLRSAISRSYYAAFWHARAYYLADGEYLTRMDAHQTIIDAFRGSHYRHQMTIGAHLQQLRARRNEADYNRTSSSLAQLRERARRSIDLATVILAALDKLEHPG